MNNQSQAARIKNFLSSRPNQWVSLSELLDLHIAQYNARIKELRAAGVIIENKTEWIAGKRYSSFRYVPRERQLTFV